jgi:HAD superfamily hydrolase (TIGR01490 family)
MKIAFFDFDGTITKADSTARFIRYLVGDSKFFIGIFFLLPFMFLYILNLISNNSIKQILITYFFKGKNINEFKKNAEYFSLNMLEPLIRKKALKEIEWHKENGHDVVIVSASIDLWLRPWCIKNDVALISSMLEVNDNVITGKTRNKNCYGLEKVTRIKELYNLSEYSYIYSYGNSRGDYEMLKIANESHYKPFT